MPQLKPCGAVMGLALVALASCVPPRTLTPPGPTPIRIVLGGPNTYTDVQWRDACQDIVVFDGLQAYADAPPERPLLWTFGVNFKVLSQTHHPVGCFKLYVRDDNLKSYTLLDTFLVDTCTVNGQVAAAAPTPAPFTFSGGYVACAMNVADWVRSVKDKYPGHEMLLESFYLGKAVNDQPRPNLSLHTYESFTMVAKAMPEAIQGESGQVPLMLYRPRGNATPDILLALQRAGSGVSFGDGKCPPFSLPFSSSHYWWYDLRKNATAQRSTYSPNYDGTTTLSIALSQTQIDIIDCGAGHDKTPFDFWIQEATLYIGSDGTTSNAVFIGKMDGVLIDPLDSKPPM